MHLLPYTHIDMLTPKYIHIHYANMKHSCPKTEFQKIIIENATIIEQQNNK